MYNKKKCRNVMFQQMVSQNVTLHYHLKHLCNDNLALLDQKQKLNLSSESPQSD